MTDKPQIAEHIDKIIGAHRLYPAVLLVVNELKGAEGVLT